MKTRFMPLMFCCVLASSSLAGVAQEESAPSQPRVRKAAADGPELAASSLIVHGTVNAAIYSQEPSCSGGDFESVILTNVGSETAVLDFALSALPDGVSLVGIDMQVPLEIPPGDSSVLTFQFCNNLYGGSESLDQCTYSIPGTSEGWLDFGLGGIERGVTRITVIKTAVAPPLPSISFDWDGPPPDTLWLNGRYEFIFSSSNFCTHSYGEISGSRVSYDCGESWYDGFQSTSYRWGLFSPRDTGSCCLLIISMIDPLGIAAEDTLTFTVVPYKGPVLHVSMNALQDWQVGTEELPFSSIQAAIDVADEGDTVLVDDGHYYERISFLGKKIIVTSNYLLDGDTLHIYQTIIDGDTAFVPLLGDTGSVVRFVNGEDSLSALVGFTIQNGFESDVSCLMSSPRIFATVIQLSAGFGVYIAGSSLGVSTQIDSCLIQNNYSSGIRIASLTGNTAVITRSQISYNEGDGISCSYREAPIRLETSTISHNSGVGIRTYWFEHIRNCLIEFNAGGIGLSSGKGLEPESGEKNSSREIRNVVIRNNGYGVEFGGSVWAFDSCLFENNFETGLSALSDARAIVTNCVFRENGNPLATGAAIKFRSDANHGFFITGTLFEDNEAEHGGAIACGRLYNQNVTNCTFIGNTAQLGSTIYQYQGFASQSFQLTNCTFSYNMGGPLVHRPIEPGISSGLSMIATCTNIFGNEGGDWIDTLATQLGVNGNISANPLFCDTAAGDYRIKDSSPCAPANNSCGVLIGAYGIGCANIAPVLTSGESAQAVSGLGIVYKATATDVDGPSTIYSFINLPSWLTASGDSAFGIPPLTEIDTSFMVIVSDGFLADSLTVTVEITESPVISALTTEGVAIAMNVISQTPTFGWQYFDATGSYPQTQFEIAVGSDSDWTHSELWNPAPFSGNATSRQYAGAALEDGQTYWVRARVRNALIWSNWKQTSFRMNSVPGVPEQRLPVDNSIVNTEHPTLVVRNPSDAENDSMLITFELSADSFATSIFPIEVKMSSDSLTSFWVNFPLNEDLRFWWRVKASDYYEESAYSPIWSFWINGVNSTPTAFSLLSPPNGSSPALPINVPEFTWQSSLDIDPGDSVEFTLQLAIDPSFSFMSQITGLTSPNYLTATPLEWGRRYWWRVKAEDRSMGVRWSNETFDFKIMALGDADGSGTVTISDVVYLINYIFGGGAAPNPIESGDADCSGAVTISDVVYLINYIFAGTAAPCEG